ncbi:MAG: hypothetical protein F4029_11550 [Gammaproteobacteria bacterium]|nr:hypothetical protein [Gammaproteobacteria bacterium]MYF31488.1 hypothetical protein [Gammaproteobacteria bacterium]MYK46846.1 hypothetical protein [Gammaproteobacteria bacterium]
MPRSPRAALVDPRAACDPLPDRRTRRTGCRSPPTARGCGIPEWPGPLPVRRRRPRHRRP